MKKGFSAGIICLSLVSASFGAEYLTEYFSFAGEFDLNGLSMTFTPDGDTNFTVNAVTITDFPVSPDSHTTISMWNHTSGDLDLLDGDVFPFFGELYNTIYIGSSGYITFGSSDTDTWLTANDHFTRPRVTTIAGDWHPSDGGRVKVGMFSDRFVLTFIDVPLWSTGLTSSYQTELHFDGVIVMSWVDIQSMPGGSLVGLSAGGGIPSDYQETDLSDFARDRDEDGVWDEWERIHFTTLDACVATNDFDGDGYDNFAEYVCGSLPKDASSFFTVSNTNSAAGPVMIWPVMEGRTYTVLRAPELVNSSFTPHLEGLEYPVNAFTSSVSSATGFYKVEVELAE